MSVALSWPDLERTVTPDREGYVKRRVRPELKIDMFLAISRPSGRRCLLLSGPGIRPGLVPTFAGSRGVNSRLVVASPPTPALLEISLVDASFSDMFDRLLDDVVSGLPVSAAEHELAGLVIARLLRWQKFLRASPLPLGAEAQRGLFGELWFLEQHLWPSRGAAAVDCWVGPSGAAQDFHVGTTAVEVKTSIADQDQAVRISGERQLDDVGVGRLYLFHLSLDKRAGANSSLTDLVRRVRRLLDTTPWSDSFEDKLAELGYSDADAAHYAESGYALREQGLFRVRSGFPRLVEAALPDGVADVHYSVTLSACKPFAVDLSELSEDG